MVCLTPWAHVVRPVLILPQRYRLSFKVLDKQGSGMIKVFLITHSPQQHSVSSPPIHSSHTGLNPRTRPDSSGKTGPVPGF